MTRKFPEWPEVCHKLRDLMDAQLKLWHGELCEALRKNGEAILASNTRFYLMMKRADRC